MTVGFHSPLPPARSGVADYSSALLAELRRTGRVVLGTGDIELYHMGNNALHAPIYRRVLQRPGVVVLHDAVFQHFYLGQLNEAEYCDEFAFNYGEWNRGLARELWRARAGSAADDRYFRYPMLRRAAERSLAVIVHNPAAARTVREHAPATRIVEIPHLFAPPPLPDEAAVLGFRERLGVHPGAFLFGVFGYLRESKRLITALEAFAVVRRQIPHAALLIAGDFVSSHLERAVEPMLAATGVMRLPHLGERDFWLAACSIDACINLRYPAAGESSGIATRMMGIGKPVLVTEGEEYARVPEDACIRIPAGPAERDSLLHHMAMLASMNGVATAIGVRAAAFIQAHHRVETICEHYWETLREVARTALVTSD